MDLASYAELAVRLVNTLDPGRPAEDRLADLAALRELLYDRPHMGDIATRQDLEGLRLLREELREVFLRASHHDTEGAVRLLNGLLVRFPVQPQITGHGGRPWHLHLTESGTVADKYAAGCVMGLAVLVTELGVDRLGLCQAAPCGLVYLDVSSNRSRRYCSERCASRANVAAYRARRRETVLGGNGR